MGAVPADAGLRRLPRWQGAARSQHVGAGPRRTRIEFVRLLAALGGDFGAVDVAGLASRADLAALFEGVFGGTLDTGVPAAVSGMAFWLADNPTEPRLLVSRGLPGRDDFVSMLGASGREPGAETIF